MKGDDMKQEDELRKEAKEEIEQLKKNTTTSLQESIQLEINVLKDGRDLFEELHELLIDYHDDPEYNSTIDIIKCAEKIGQLKAYEDVLGDIWMGYRVDEDKLIKERVQEKHAVEVISEMQESKNEEKT